VDDAEPSKYFLSTLPEDTPIEELIDVAHQRWRIERDYQDLKQDFGLGHYEGRGWRGFHHHAALSIAAYGFLMAERLAADKPVGGKKTSSNAKCLPFPRITSPRQSYARSATRRPRSRRCAID
jgi:SRSO17 transposase